MVWLTPTAVQNLQVGGHGCKFTGSADGLSESVQENTGWLHLAQNRGSWQTVFEMWKEPSIDGPRVPIHARAA